MKEGTKSVLFGCHNPLIHGIFVLMAWRLEYKSWPKWWEVICIFLHDIGVWGRQYLSDDRAKIGHWKLGATIATNLVFLITRDWVLSLEAHYLVAGHCPEESGYRKSKLWTPDKKCSLVTPIWLLWWNYWIEWHGKHLGVTKPPLWRKLVVENLKKKEPIGNHELYIKHRVIV